MDNTGVIFLIFFTPNISFHELKLRIFKLILNTAAVGFLCYFIMRLSTKLIIKSILILGYTPRRQATLLRARQVRGRVEAGGRPIKSRNDGLKSAWPPSQS